MAGEGCPLSQMALPSRTAPAAAAPAIGQLLDLVLGVVIVGALYLGRELLVPITLAILLAFVLAPLVRLLRRCRLPHVAAVFLTVALSVAAICGTGALIGAQLASLGQDLPKYQQTIESKIQQVGGLTTGRLAEIAGRFGLQAQQAGHQAAKAAGLAKGQAKPAAAPTLVEVYRPPTTPLGMARQLLRPVLGPLAAVGLVFVLTVFALLQQGDLRDRLIRLIGSSDLHRTTTAMNDAATRLSRYFLAQVSVNVGFGVVIGSGLAVIGVPHAVLWGAVAALLRFIPYLGGLVSTGLATAMAAAVDPGWTLAGFTIALFLVVEAATGQLVEPLLYGRRTGLSAVSVVVAAVFWTWLWGPVGLILSTPLSLCLLVLGSHVPRLAFIEVLLGDRPPLTPVESFYQRVLAGDAEDVLQQAQLLVAETSLASYYDDVALKGLLLAAHDAQRGILKRDQLTDFKLVIEDAISVLAQTPEPSAEGPAHRARGRLVCVGGPGLLDDLASEMLCQLLTQRALNPMYVPYRAAASSTIDALHISADLICIVHLSVGQSQRRLIQLTKRIAASSSAPQVVALVRGEGALAWTGRNARVVSSLMEAVEDCATALSAKRRKGPSRRSRVRTKTSAIA